MDEPFDIKNLQMTRGFIVDRFILIENLICTIISQHYLGHPDADFVVNVLGNELSNFGFKRNILEHIIEEKEDNKKQIDNLHKLNRIRNLFCHSTPKVKEDKEKENKQIFFTNPKSPKNQDKELNMEKELEKFKELHAVVSSWLINIAKAKGVTGFP